MRKLMARVAAVLAGPALLFGLASPLATSGSTQAGVAAQAGHANHSWLAFEHFLHTLQSTSPTAHFVHPGVAIVNGPVNELPSLNWSGYADAATDQPITDNCSSAQDGCGSISYVSASWVIPPVLCPAPPFRDEDQVMSNWIGIDGLNDSTVEQIGTLGGCYEGQAFYYNWYEMYPNNTVILGPATCATENVGCSRPGDRITASVAVAPSGTPGVNNYTLTLTDYNSPANSATTTQPCATDVCFDSSAQWIVERPALEPAPGFIQFTPLSFFAITGFTHGEVVANGQPSTIGGYSAGDTYYLPMVDDSVSYYLDCPVQSEPIGSLLLFPTTTNAANPCPPVPPGVDFGFAPSAPAGTATAAGTVGNAASSVAAASANGANAQSPGNGFGFRSRQSSFTVTWDDSF